MEKGEPRHLEALEIELGNQTTARFKLGDNVGSGDEFKI